MKNKNVALVMIVGLLLFCGKTTQSSPDSQAKEIISRIQASKNAILSHKKDGKALCAEPADCLFLTFWDFDGTILKGDCTEGLIEDGKIIYKGMQQVAIENGYSSTYDSSSYPRFHKDYLEMDETKGHETAYQFLAQIFKGQERRKIEALSVGQFESTIKNFYFKQSIEILNSLQNQSDFRPYIISASPDFFVKGSANTVDIPIAHIRGVNLEDKGGILTDKVILPITYAEGKARAIERVVSEIKTEGKFKNVFVLAGFGNSYHTDGNFLKYIASQKLPAGNPISVMINGGHAPAEYQNLFFTVHHEATVK